MEQTQRHILEGLKVADRCVQLLEEVGITVLTVTVGGHKPVIDIAPTNKLQGVMTVRRPTLNGTEEVIATAAHGCQIQWKG